MFHVLREPFPKAITEHFSKDGGIPYMAIVYSGERGERVLIATFGALINLSNGLVVDQNQWFYDVVAELNNPPDSEFLKLMLRSVKEQHRLWERVREAQKRRGFRDSNFRADFGRRDFSSPGQGGSGFDGYW